MSINVKILVEMLDDKLEERDSILKAIDAMEAYAGETDALEGITLSAYELDKTYNGIYSTNSYLAVVYNRNFPYSNINVNSENLDNVFAICLDCINSRRINESGQIRLLYNTLEKLDAEIETLSDCIGVQS